MYDAFLQFGFFGPVTDAERRQSQKGKSKERRKVTELLTGQQRLFEAIIKLSSEERTAYFTAFAGSGIPEALATLHELDQQVLSEYPDATNRRSAINAKRLMQRAPRNGRSYDVANATYGESGERDRKAENNKLLSDDVTKDARLALEAKVREVLEQTGGNKAQAAQLLGLSQRLSGVEHRCKKAIPMPNAHTCGATESTSSDAGPRANFDNGATVGNETSSSVPSREEIETVARRRYQHPQPFMEGRFWWLFIRRDEVVAGKRMRVKERVKLAPIDERHVKKPPKEIPPDICKRVDEVLRPLNEGLLTIGSATKFDDYVEEYKLTILPTLTARTQERYKGIIRNYLSPEFGQLPLRELTALRIQKYFSGLTKSPLSHKPLSHESTDKIRDVLSSILGSAKHYGLIVTNPAEGVRLPPARKGKRGKPYITPDQFQQLIQLIAEPYASMLYVAMFTGLRASELVGLRWKNVHSDSITIDERYSAGEWGPPKSDASNATIAVNQSVIERIHRLKTLKVDVRAGQGAVRHYRVVKSAGPEDLVFQLVSRNGPQCPNNVLFKHIKPAARSLGIGWVNWQVLRRSHATWLKMVGADVKDAQAQMRHSRASTTLDIYQQFVPASQRQAVDRLTTLTTNGLIN